MKKFECNTCGIRICTAAYQGSRIPVNCTAGDTIAYWHEVKGEEQKLPKLTLEVFDRPDCPTWGNYAAVDKFGKGFYYRSEPTKTDHAWKLPPDCKMAHIGKFDPSDWENSLIKRPPKEELPDWVKVDNIGWHDEIGYFKVIDVDDIEKKVCIQHMNSQIEEHFSFNTVCTEARYARPRPFNEKEMKALVGKVLENHKYLIWVEGYEKDIKRIVTLLKSFTAEELMDSDYLIDREPCYVLEHLNGKGEWVK